MSEEGKNVFKTFKKHGFLIAAALFAIFAVSAMAPTPALADKTVNCGAIGQKPCPVGVKASYISKAQTRCPKGSFFDVASFKCWSCPKGFKQSGLPAGKGQGCLKPPGTDYADADKDKKIKFSNKTLKDIKKGKFDHICHSGDFYDKKGGKYGACWSCPKGFIRNVTKGAKGDKACIKVTKMEHSKATQVSGFNPCRKGFFDPRAGGQCWSCPGGYFRGVSKVNAKDACIIKPQDVCDPGNILVYGTCRKKGACGKLGERPCLVVERVPSCNKGLLEDFTQNKCVSASSLICSTVFHSIRQAQRGEKALSKKQQEVEKKIRNAFVSALQTVVGKQAFNKMTKAFRSAEKEIQKAKQKGEKPVKKYAEGPVSKLLKMKQVAAYAEAMRKNTGKLTEVMLSKDFCLMSANAKYAAMTNALGVKITPLQKADAAPHWYDGLLIRQAHASDSAMTSNSTSMGISVSYPVPHGAMESVYKKLMGKKVGNSSGGGEGAFDPGFGPSLSYYMVIANGKVAQRVGIGIDATTGAGFDINGTLGFLQAKKTQSVGGGGFSFDGNLGVSEDNYTMKKFAGIGLSVLVSNTFSYEGTELGFAARTGQRMGGKGPQSLDAALGVGWGWDFALK